MRISEIRIALLQLLLRMDDWVPAADIYGAFGSVGRVDQQRHNQIAASLRRLRIAGFVDADREKRHPRQYRITEAGRRELAVLTNPAARAARVNTHMQLMRAVRWPRQEGTAQ